MAVRLDPSQNIVGVKWKDPDTEPETEVPSEPATDLPSEPPSGPYIPFKFIAGTADSGESEAGGYRLPPSSLGTYVEGATQGVTLQEIYSARTYAGPTSASPASFIIATFSGDVVAAIEGMSISINGSVEFVVNSGTDLVFHAGGTTTWQKGEGVYPPAFPMLYTFADGVEYTIELELAT